MGINEEVIPAITISEVKRQADTYKGKVCATIKRHCVSIYINKPALDILNTNEVEIKQINDELIIKPSNIDSIKTHKITSRAQTTFSPKEDIIHRRYEGEEDNGILYFRLNIA